MRTSIWSIQQGQAFIIATIQLDKGTSDLRITGGNQVFETQISYVDPFESGIIRVNIIGGVTERLTEGAITIEPAVAPFVYPRPGTAEVKVPVGRYIVSANIAGYKPEETTVVVGGGLLVTVDFTLEKDPPPGDIATPPPTPPPTPPASPDQSPGPPVTIVSVGLTFTIQQNDKDDGSVILANIILDGKPLVSGSYGEDVTWKARTSKEFTLVLPRPLLTSDCHRMVLELRNKRNEPGQDTWLMQVIATLKLSDGDSRSIVFDSLRLYQDKPFQNNFRCPASRLGPGMF